METTLILGGVCFIILGIAYLITRADLIDSESDVERFRERSYEAYEDRDEMMNVLADFGLKLERNTGRKYKVVKIKK